MAFTAPKEERVKGGGFVAPQSDREEIPKPKATWSDVPRNALEDVKSMGAGVVDIAKAGGRFLADTARGGESYALEQRTPQILQALKSAPEAVKAIGSRVKELTPFVGDPIQAFKEHPVNTTADIASVALPVLKAAGVTGAVERGLVGVAESVAGQSGRRALGFSKGVMNKLRMLPKDAEAVSMRLMDKGVVGALDTTEELLNKTKGFKETVGQNIGDFLKTRNYSFDVREAVKRIESLRPKDGAGNLLRGGYYDALNGRIDNALATIQAHGADFMNFDEANKLKGTFQDVANYSTSKETPILDLDKAIAANFREAIDDSLLNPRDLTPQQIRRGEVPSSPVDTEKFLENKKTYGDLRKAEKGLEDKVRQVGNRAVGLTDWLLIAGGMGEAALRDPIGAFKVALALAAKKGIEKFGWSTSAAGANAIAKATGKYAPILLNAAQGGANALALAHMSLYSDSPGYKEMIDKAAREKPGEPNKSAPKATPSPVGSYPLSAVSAGAPLADSSPATALPSGGTYEQDAEKARIAIRTGAVSPEEANRRLRTKYGRGLE